MNDFLRGISRGIFTEQEKARQEQLGKEREQKGQLIDFLSTVASQAEPDSLPNVMGHLGKLLELKGKARKFWDVFSGIPDTSPEAQMGEIARNISSQLTGPGAARSARGRALSPQISQALGGGITTPAPRDLNQAAGLSDKIVLRDPRREKIEELETRFQGQLANQQAQTAFKENLMLNRMTQLEAQEQRNRKELVDYKADSKAQEDINERAWRIAINKGFREPNGPIKAQAASELAREQGWSNEKLQAQIRVLNATVTEKEAIAQSIGEFGMKTGEAGRLDLQRKNFYDDQAKEYSNSLAQIKDSAAKLKQIRDGIQRQKDANQARVQSGDITQADADLSNSFVESKERKTLSEEEGKLAGARSRATDAFNKLKDPDNIYYRVGEFGGEIAAPKKATPPVKPGRPTARAGIGAIRGKSMDDYKQVSNPNQYQVGKIYRDPTDPSAPRIRITSKEGNIIYYKVVQ